MSRQILEPEQKALEINLDGSIYGAFAEIGAGQEVARFFFKVGAAAGTIAKTMSAYDKVVSDDIYGVEDSGRYVCESRLYKMLDHEYELMENRLQVERPNDRLFAFADTVSAINYTRTIKGSGWVGIRFQLAPGEPPNDVVLHVKMTDKDNTLQQQAVGILGVNLIYACYNYLHNLEMFVTSLMDRLWERVRIDLVRVDGPSFPNIDHRLLSLYLIKNKMCDVAMFNPEKRNIHGSEFLYKNKLLIVRDFFRPITLLDTEILTQAEIQFKKHEEIDKRRFHVLTELTYEDILVDGQLDEKDFLDRTDLLCEMGQTVVLSNCQERKKLIDYLSDYKIQQYGFVLGARELLELVNEKYFQNKDGRLLSAFGEIFSQKVKIWVYPSIQEGSSEQMTVENLPIPEGVKFLYKHLIESEQIVNLEGVNAELLHIDSEEVLRMMSEDEDGWESMLPKKVAEKIKKDCLFNLPCQRIEFNY